MQTGAHRGSIADLTEAVNDGLLLGIHLVKAGGQQHHRAKRQYGRRQQADGVADAPQGFDGKPRVFFQKISHVFGFAVFIEVQQEEVIEIRQQVFLDEPYRQTGREQRDHGQRQPPDDPHQQAQAVELQHIIQRKEQRGKGEDDAAAEHQPLRRGAAGLFGEPLQPAADQKIDHRRQQADADEDDACAAAADGAHVKRRELYPAEADQQEKQQADMYGRQQRQPALAGQPFSFDGRGLSLFLLFLFRGGRLRGFRRRGGGRFRQVLFASAEGGALRMLFRAFFAGMIHPVAEKLRQQDQRVNVRKVFAYGKELFKDVQVPGILLDRVKKEGRRGQQYPREKIRSDVFLPFQVFLSPVSKQIL